MNTRELLELSAKAAGLDRTFYECAHYWGMVDNNDPDSGVWNPLEYDDDAFRLMVGLNFLVQVRPTVTFVTDDDGKQLSFRPHKPHGGDAFAATRMAITRAAAEIGKAMK